MSFDFSTSISKQPERGGQRDTLRNHHRQSLRMLLLTLCAITPCVVLALWAQGERGFVLGIPAALGLVSLALLPMLNSSRAGWVPVLLVYTALIAGTGIALVDGSVRSVGVLVMLAGVVGAGTYLRRATMLLSVGMAVAALGALNLAQHHGWMQPLQNPSELVLWMTQVAVMVCLLVMLFYGRKRLETVLETQQQALERWERVAKALQLSEARFTALFQNTPAATLVQRHGTREVLEVNQAFARLVGHERSALLGHKPPDLWASESDQQLFRSLVESQGRVHAMPATGRRKDGSTFECLVFAELVEAGADRLVMTMLLDVSAEVAAKRALAKSEARFVQSFKSSPLSMTITRMSDGLFLEANPADERLLGFSREDLMGRTSLQVGLWVTEAERNTYITALGREGRLLGFETRMRNKRGDLIDVRIWSERIELDNEPCDLAFALNVTEEKRQQTMWRQVAKGVSGQTGEAFFRSLVEQLACALGAVGVVVANIEDADHIDAVARMCDGVALPSGPLPSQHPLLLQVLEHNGLLVTLTDHAAVRDLCPSRTATDRLSFAAMALRDDDGSAIGLLGAFWPDSPEPTTNLASLMTIFASRCNAELLRLRRDRELARLNATLEKRVAERTAQLQMLNRELDTFAYSVSHDLKSPLRSIDGFMHLLQEQTSGRTTEDDQALMARVIASTRRMGGLINDLLALARVSQTQLQFVEVNLSEMAEEVIQQERLRDPAHEADVQIVPGLVAQCDPRMARIVLENLLGNAWKYSAQAAQPRIELVGLPPTADGLPRFMVRDNGAGFEMTRADRLFKPFSRLHQPTEFQGSGIGLATVRRIIERHGGQISGEGQVGCGASFQFHFGRPAQD
jgi:PAS domain S-box-containing protein